MSYLTALFLHHDVLSYKFIFFRNEEEKVDGAISYLCKGLELHRDSEDLWLKYFELLERKSTPTDTLMKLLEQAVGRHVSASVALNWKVRRIPQ